jgi:hypothetical protein
MIVDLRFKIADWVFFSIGTSVSGVVDCVFFASRRSVTGPIVD